MAITQDPVVTLSVLDGFEARLKGWIDTRLGEFATALRLDFAGLVDAILKRLDHLEIEYEMLKAGIARVEADVAALKAAYGDLTGAFEDLRGDFGGLRTEVAGLKADVGVLKADVGVLKADVGLLKADVASLRAESDQQRSALIRLEAETAAVKAAVVRLEEARAEDRGRLLGEVAAVRQRIDDFELRVRDLSARLERR
jgi:chromosome segregation ATPase